MAIEHWIFAPTYHRARWYVTAHRLGNWRYATRDQFRGVHLDGRHTIHILDGFENEELEVELKWAMALSLVPPQIIDQRGHWDIPDLTDPTAVEAWLDAE